MIFPFSLYRRLERLESQMADQSLLLQTINANLDQAVLQINAIRDLVEPSVAPSATGEAPALDVTLTYTKSAAVVQGLAEIINKLAPPPPTPDGGQIPNEPTPGPIESTD